MTLAEILAKFQAGSEERLKALEEWRRAEDQRLGANPPPVKMPTGKRQLATPVGSEARRPVGRPPGPDYEARREWERRRDEAERAKEAEQAAALRARVNHAVKLTVVRVNALPDMSTRREKLRRLEEIQASLIAHNPKTIAVISRGLTEIENRLARLSAE